MSDVDEEFICFRFVNPETNQELKNIPKSSTIIIKPDASIHDGEEEGQEEDIISSLETNSIQPNIEADEISNALMDVDNEINPTSSISLIKSSVSTTSTSTTSITATSLPSPNTETKIDNTTKIITDDNKPMIKKPFYKRRHFKQLFIKGDNVVYVCEDSPHTFNFFAQCKNKYEDLKYPR